MNNLLMLKLSAKKIKQEQNMLMELLPEKYDLPLLSEKHDFLMKKSLDLMDNTLDDALAGTMTVDEKVKIVNAVTNMGRYIENKRLNSMVEEDGLIMDDELIIEGTHAKS